MQHTNNKNKVQLILPSLIQSKTTEREDSQSESIVTLNTPTGYPSNEDTEPDNDSDNDSQHSISSRSSMSSSPSDTVNTYKHHDFGSEDDDETGSSSSSDWEPSISLASTYLPRNNKKSNNKLELKPYSSLLESDTQSQVKLKQLECMNNILFYPYTNLQSLIFSNSYCYIENDYKKIKNVNLNEDTDACNNNITDMDWNDTESVNKIKDLLRNLLVSASLTIGIKEEEIYLMFSSPSPQEIIEQLRFGILSKLCDVHMDRFGRRSYYRKNINYNDPSNQINIHSEEEYHFYNHSHLPTNLFGTNDMNNLSNFITESPTVTTVNGTPMTPSTDMDSYPPLPESSIDNGISPPVNENNLSPPVYPIVSKHALQKEKQKRNINTIHKHIKNMNKPKHVHIKHMSEDKLDWKNIDVHQPVTYLLTKTKTTTYNHNPKRTATDIGNLNNKKHKKNKNKNKNKGHKVGKMPVLGSLPEERAKNIKVKAIANKNKNKNKNKNNKHNKNVKSKLNNKSPKQKPKQSANNKNKMRVAKVPRKVLSESDNSLHEMKKYRRKRKVTFEENNNNNSHVKVNKKSNTKVKMKSMGKQKSYSPKSKPMIHEMTTQKKPKKKRSYTIGTTPAKIKLKTKKRSYSGLGHGSEKDKNSKKMSADEFKAIDLYDIIGKNNTNLNDNFEIAKGISKYFDNIFGDTDTVSLVSEMNKQPAISYWIKGRYVRKDRNILNGKYVLVYRSCKHIPANKPIVSKDEFEHFVENICVKYKNKSVNYICEKLDSQFGDGCHFIRCNLKTYNCFDVYCRFSDQYECSFKLKEQKHFIIAWRR